jgi:hypothetical protein
MITYCFGDGCVVMGFRTQEKQEKARTEKKKGERLVHICDLIYVAAYEIVCGIKVIIITERRRYLSKALQHGCTTTKRKSCYKKKKTHTHTKEARERERWRKIRRMKRQCILINIYFLSLCEIE